MLKRTLLAAALALAFTASALASSCPKHMKEIDAALAKSPKLSAEQMTEVKSLRAQGEEMHKAGKHDESMAALTRAEGILGIKDHK